MIIDLTDSQARAVLGSMCSIGRSHHGQLTDTDRRTVDAAAKILLGKRDLEAESPADCSPEQLADSLDSPEEAKLAVRMLAVMSLVDGVLDREKTERVQVYADAVGVGESYLAVLHEATTDEIAQAAACMIRKNAESFPNLELEGIDADPVRPFLPYRDGRDQPELESRYAALGELAPGTFGRAFFEHFKLNGFEFPGNPKGLAEGFTTPHDSSHVLSGYTTSQQGELCVSTFIGAMHPDHPMAAEVLPVLFSWHLGVKLNEIAGSSTGAYDARKFWTAWDRGDAMKVDVVNSDWDFWAATEESLDELRREYGLPPVGPDLLA